jgi:serine O-acetyltransferase
MESNNLRSVPHPEHGAEKLYYLSHRLYRKNLFKLANIIKRINTFLFRNYIPPSTIIGKRLELAHGGCGVIIHGDTVIGDDAIIFQHVTIGNGGAIIGDRVYIGAGAIILGKIRIGDDVAIGANAVVNYSVPSGHTVVGPKSHILIKNV